MIISELRARYTLQRKKGDFSNNLLLLENLQKGYDNDKNAQEAKGLQGDRPGCRPGGAHHKRPPQVHEVLGTGNEHFQNNCENGSVRGLEVQSLCYAKGMKIGQFMSEASKPMLDLLKESFLVMWAKEIWPPSSPDCKSLDYFVCGVSEFRVNAKPHNKTAYLIPKIMVVMESLDRNTMAKAYRRFGSSSETFVAAEGYFIE
jgi:hypothetical protein